MKTSRLIKLVTLLTTCCAFAAAGAATVAVTVGDDDGFGGTQGPISVPGTPFTAFPTPAIGPGTYVGDVGTDVTTQSPWTPYVFIFNFAWDTIALTSIDSAIIQVQSGSVGRRADGSGFGFAKVSVNSGSGFTPLDDFWSTSTGANASSLEENVKLHAFDVKSFISAGTSGVLTLRVDGSALTGPADQFALDFSRLTVSQVPEAGTALLLCLGLLPVALASRRRHA
jgi:hypothetical protein